MLEIIAAFFRGILFLAGYISPGFPEPLTQEEERTYIQRLLTGDPEAKTKLIEHNLRLVAHIAKKYNSSPRDSDDLISIGTIGLIKAVSTFDPARGSTLATYASRCIDNEILMSLRAQKRQAGEISINEPIGTDKDGNEISLADVLGSDPDEIHDKALLLIAAQQLRKAVTQVLDKREQTVITLRYGLLNGSALPQREVAKLLGISRSYVSRIEKKAVLKLKRHLTED